MLFNWKGIVIVITVLAVVVGLCALDLSCSGEPEQHSTIARVKNEIAAGKQEFRNLEADDLAKLARDLRILARRYAEKGEKKKAQRAIGAAQELDRKIRQLRGTK